MKTSRVLLAAIPVGVFALGAVALGMWSFRNVFSSSPTARESDSKLRANEGGVRESDGPRVIAGSAEEVAKVAEAMAEDGGAVLVTEVTPTAAGEAIVTETLLVTEPIEPEVKS